jgi:hypothetical protein
MKLLHWFILTFAVILGWAGESPMMGVIFFMLALGIIWSLYAFFERFKPGSRV